MCDDCQILLDALIQHFDDDIKRHQNRIKYLNEPDERTPEEKKQYHERQIENTKLKKDSFIKRWREDVT